MWGLPFCSLFVAFFTSLPAYFFIYLFLPFFIFYFFFLSLCHSISFFSIFLEPEPKPFHVTWVNNYIDILFFTRSVMGNQNNIVKFGVPCFFGCSGVPGCSGVFRSVPDCLLFLCSGVPRFSTCHSFNHF